MSIILKEISKAFDGKVVLDNFSAKIPYGSRVCIMGESGSGKTTLLNIIMGLVQQDSGIVLGMADKKISVVFQEERLVNNLTPYRNIKLVCGNKIQKNDILDAMERVGLSKSCIHEKTQNLSGGMKRRVSILAALLSGGDIVIMDEPTKGLDDTNKELVYDFILNMTKHKTLLVVTHDINEAKRLSEKIINI